MSSKYADLGHFIRENRKIRFRSAREFCQKTPLGISYPQYSRYEAGEQLPSVDQALNLFKLLNISIFDGLLKWTQAQVQDPEITHELKSMETLLQSLKNKSSDVSSSMQVKSASFSTTVDRVPLDDVVVFNRSHLKIFDSDPVYRDIFTYVNSFSPDWVPAEEVSQALEVPLKKLEKMLEKLRDLGVLVFNAGKCKATKRNYYYPDDDDFFALRNSNYKHNSQAILGKLTREDLSTKRAFRGLLTRELTLQQVQAIVQHLEEFLGNIIALPETPSPEAIYSVCVLLGKRFSRPKQIRSPVTAELSTTAF